MAEMKTRRQVHIIDVYDQNRWKDLPADLWPRRALPSGVEKIPLRQEVPRDSQYTGIVLARGFQGRTVAIGMTPSLIVRAEMTAPYMILNPSRQSLLTTPALGKSLSNEVVAGNTQATPINVSGFSDVHVFLDITAVVGQWDIFMQTYDELSQKWADAQLGWGAIGAVGTYYAAAGTIGIASKIAFRWAPVVAGNITFSLGVVLKSGTGGSASGIDQFIFLGNESVTPTSGYPLLEGTREVFLLLAGTEIWGVSRVSGLEVRVFEL